MTDMLIVLLNEILQLLRKVKHSIRRDLRKMLVEYLIGLFLDNRFELIDHHACRKILQLRVTA